MTTDHTVTSRDADNLPIGKPALIGRVQERDAVTTIVRRAITEARPQVVTVIGNAGVGKSRLVTEVIADLRENFPDLRAYRGVARTESGLHPAIAHILRERFGVREDADALAQANEVCAQVMELFGDKRVDEILHFLGAFLGLRAGTTALAEAVDEDPRTFQLVSMAVLRRFFEVDAKQSPLLLVFEDLQYAGPDGIRTLRTLIEQVRGAPIVVLCTARPELLTKCHDFCATPKERHLRVDLAPLSQSESEVLVGMLLSRIVDCPRSLVSAAVGLGGGNPQLLNTLVRIFFDRGVIELGEGGMCLINEERLGQISLPMSVEDSVHARLSALTPAEREVLEWAAIMGPAFWLGGLVVLGRVKNQPPQLWGGSEDLAHHYRDLLNGLERREYVARMPRSAIAGDEEFVFRNSMERERVEALVSTEDAVAWHQVIAEWLEFRFGDFHSEEQHDLLSRHYILGDRPLRAARHVAASGDIARKRYANQKAIQNFRKALELFGENDIKLRLDAHEALGGVLRIIGDTEGASEQYQQMLSLAWRLDLKHKGGIAHNLLGRLQRDVGDLDKAMRHFGTGLALFQSVEDQRGIATSHDDIGYTHWRRGSFDTAERFLQDGLDRREALGDKYFIALSLNNIALVYQDTGQYKLASEALDRSLTLRQEIDDKPGQVITLNNLGTLHQDTEDHISAISVWCRALDIARAIGDRRRQALLLLNIGEGKYRTGNVEESMKILTEVEELCVELGDKFLLAESRRALGKAFFGDAKFARAESYLERALELFEQVKSRLHTAIAQRSLAEVLMVYGREDEKGHRAEALFRKALQTFEELNAEIEIARTGSKLAEFLLEGTEGKPPPPATFAEADELRQRSEDIFEKIKRDSRVSSTIDPKLLMTNQGKGRLRPPSVIPVPDAGYDVVEVGSRTVMGAEAPVVLPSPSRPPPPIPSGSGGHPKAPSVPPPAPPQALGALRAPSRVPAGAPSTAPAAPPKPSVPPPPGTPRS
jgi:tetratricopeptide (TPR) repeat protein